MSKTTAQKRAAAKFLCPGCAKLVHGFCGYEHLRDIVSDYQFTCFVCYDKFGRAFSGDTDPDCHPKTEAKRIDLAKSKEKEGQPNNES